MGQASVQVFRKLGRERCGGLSTPYTGWLHVFVFTQGHPNPPLCQVSPRLSLPSPLSLLGTPPISPVT